MNIDLFISMFAFLANLFLGYVSYRSNPKNLTNRLLAIMTLIIAIWIAFNYQSLHASTEATTLFWIRAVMGITTPLGPILYLFLKSFPDGKYKIAKIKLNLIVISMAVVFAVSVSPLTFPAVSTANGTIIPTLGWGILLYALYAFGFALAGFTSIINKYKTAHGLVKIQLKYLILGVILTFALQLITNLLSVMLGYSGAVAFGPLSSLFLVGSISYAVVKHQLLDIRFVLARTISYSLLTFIIIGFYTISLFLIGRIFVPESFSSGQLVLSILLAIVTAYTFQPLKTFLERVTDRIFYHDNYSSQELIATVTKILASEIEIRILSSSLLKELYQSLKISKATLVVVRGKSQIFAQNYPLEMEKSEVPDLNDLVALSQLSPKLYIFETLIENTTKKILREKKIGTALVMKIDEDMEVLLLLGEKLSGDIYTKKDIEVLTILSAEIMISIKNASYVEEIQRFNITLKEEVDRATNKLSSANRRLLELDKLKDEFVSMASHELRTPMVSIRNYVWMVLNGKGGKVNPKQREYLRRAYDSTSRLSRLVNSMLNLSRIESGRVILSVEQADIRKVIKDVITEIGMRADKAGIKLTLRQKVEGEKSGEAVQLPSVLIDIDKIKEVLINLIGNSLKFTPAGGSITGTLTVGKQFVKVGITDTGVGLNDEQIPKLFQKFSMLRESYSSNATMAQGTGLGLYICKSIIELHGGKIWIESEGAGKGSTFFFTIPRYSEERLHLLTKNQHNGKDAGIIHSAVTDY